jgi:NPCBM/NEW2 domain
MTGVALLWTASIACLIVALLGKSAAIGSVQIPETAEKKARIGLAIVGMLALVLGIIIFVRPNGDQESAQAAAKTRPTSIPSLSPPSSDQSQDNGLPTDSPSSSPQAGSSTGLPSATLYLADQTGTTGGGAGADSPESGTWIMAGATYLHSIGYPGLGLGYGEVTFTLNGSYTYFIATVGVADSADPNDQSTQVTFEVDDGSGDELGSEAAQYSSPQVIKIPLQGITSLTLLTNAPAGFYADSNAFVAVWGDARVVRSPWISALLTSRIPSLIGRRKTAL